MMRRGERDGVNLLLGQIPSIRRLLSVIIASGEQQDCQEHDKANLPHRHSSDNVYNQTPGGSGAHLQAVGRVVRANGVSHHRA